MGVDDRLQTMKGVGVLHPVEVEVPAQHIISHPQWFVLFSFSFHTWFAIFSSPPFLHPLFGCVPPPTPFHVFVLKFSVFPRFSVKVLSFAQISRSLPFPSSTFCCYLYRHLLTNISLFLILPTTLHGTCLILLVPTLWCHSSLAPSPSPSSFPGSLCPGSLTIVGAYTTKQLSPAHRGVCECVFARVCVCSCAYVCWAIIERECVYVSMRVSVCVFLFILRCTALVLTKTIKTMCQTGSIILELFMALLL